MSIYVRNIFNDLIKTICFIMKIHIMNDFKMNILIDINIITSKKMLVNLNVKILFQQNVKNCKLPSMSLLNQIFILNA